MSGPERHIEKEGEAEDLGTSSKDESKSVEGAGGDGEEDEKPVGVKNEGKDDAKKSENEAEFWAESFPGGESVADEGDQVDDGGGVGADTEVGENERDVADNDDGDDLGFGFLTGTKRKGK